MTDAATPVDQAHTSAPVAATEHYSGSTEPDAWWNAHYNQATDSLIDFFAGDGISLTGKSIADIGCGDGIIDLALAAKAKPDKLIGYDLVATDRDHLADLARRHGAGPVPECLTFVGSGESTIPADTASFDFVISWSAFEHILDVDGIAAEIHRILKPTGVLFVQLWPFYASAHGTHLVDWFPRGFAQYEHSDEQILDTMRSTGNQDAVDGMFTAYQTLNRITIDELGAALRRNHFRVVKLELQGDAVHIPASAAHLPLSHAGVSGVMMLAIPDHSRSAGRTRPAFSAPSTAERPVPTAASRRVDAGLSVLRRAIAIADRGVGRVQARRHRQSDD